MPRDLSGNYTLPVGNPVVNATVISPAWGNTTLSDIALQLNQVVTRDGLLGPTALLTSTAGATWGGPLTATAGTCTGAVISQSLSSVDGASFTIKTPMFVQNTTYTVSGIDVETVIGIVSGPRVALAGTGNAGCYGTHSMPLLMSTGAASPVFIIGSFSRAQRSSATDASLLTTPVLIGVHGDASHFPPCPATVVTAEMTGIRGAVFPYAGTTTLARAIRGYTGIHSSGSYGTANNVVLGEVSALSGWNSIGNAANTGTTAITSLYGLRLEAPTISGPGITITNRYAISSEDASGLNQFAGPFQADGQVSFPGVGTTASGANAYLDNAASPANRLLRVTSSRKYKKNIEPLDPSHRDAILGLQPVWYRSKSDADNPAWSWFGLIAEDVALVEPRLVTWSYADSEYRTVTKQVQRQRTIDTDKNSAPRTEVYFEDVVEQKLKNNAELSPDGVQYDRLTVLLLAKVQELTARIIALENP